MMMFCDMLNKSSFILLTLHPSHDRAELAHEAFHHCDVVVYRVGTATVKRRQRNVQREAGDKVPMPGT